MITYNGPRDLKMFGFDCLTGEACGLTLRLLYDVNETGRAIVARTLGLRSDQLNLPDSWNNTFTAGSVMLTDDAARTCALFGMLFHSSCTEVWQVANEHGVVRQLIGWQVFDEEDRKLYVQFLKDHDNRLPGDQEPSRIRVFKGSTAPGTGDRNQHMMSGRVQ